MAVTWKFRCLVWVMLSGFVTAYAANFCWASDGSWTVKAAAGILAGLCGLSTVIALHISTLRCSETHTLATLLAQYLIMQVFDLIAPSVYRNLKKVWKYPRKEQDNFLLKLLARDAKTEYGMTHGFSDIKSLQEFREKHPLTKYEHYRDYFTRLADGEKNVCVAATLERFGTSSGTTGKGKLIPMVTSSHFQKANTVLSRLLYSPDPVQKVAILYSKPAEKFTKSGARIAPLVFFPDSTISNFFMSAVQNTPPSGFQISSDFEATYVNMLFALTDKNMGQFFAPFASQVYRGLKMLEDDREMFLEDLTEGRVNPKIQLDEGIRRSLDAALTADPARADELRREFAKGFVGIMARIWPHLVHMSTIDISGYMKNLEARYSKGVPLYTSGYGCTEGLIGLNAWKDKTPQQYTFLPNDMLIELIPEHLSPEENPETLLMDEVEVGKRYEIAMTTASGFYRYRMGDVVEVVDFIESCPVFTVSYRTGELLNLRSEKIDVLVVNKAIQESLEGWDGATLVEWTCAESPLLYEDKNDGEYDMFYLLFVELESDIEIRLSADQKSLFDKSLRKQHEFYEQYRKVGTICGACVEVVRPGSFNKLKYHIIATSTSSYNQFKIPKKLRTKALLDFMLDCVVNDND
ncbi:probable indole-3-acetic acid-amido synthetase GH3.9 [Asterias rubens]|uniref:probable indole-3-acetic acid-amido synthetase GH3.9 n=1 Tax=Asterias rubens TaxID=7604 RepID=UPI001454EC04|nr:probable indole-3-acetic acid-amido synthetase GH3.9 [Asterias rubens]